MRFIPCLTCPAKSTVNWYSFDRVATGVSSLGGTLSMVLFSLDKLLRKCFSGTYSLPREAGICSFSLVGFPSFIHCSISLCTSHSEALKSLYGDHLGVPECSFNNEGRTATYHRVGNLAGIKFGNFGQNTLFLNLASFKFGSTVT